MAAPVLYIGDKRFSSWSLRPWLVLRRAGIAFEERLVALYRPETRTEIAAVSPGGTVPALHVDGSVIWDSLAISEWAAEQAPHLWPQDAMLRARARSAVSMMHSGFMALRDACPMDLVRKPGATALNDAARADIAAVQALWSEVGSGDGPYLFGSWSVADAFFTPVATRFRNFEISLTPDAQAYCDTLLSDDTFLEWEAAALQDDAARAAQNT